MNAQSYATSFAIILRCPPGKTKEVFEEFKEDRPGVIWAPLITRTKRLPRQRKRVTVTTAALPGYLFLAEDRGPLARTLQDLERKGCKPMWTHEGFFARCPMTELFRLHEAVSGISKTLSSSTAEKEPETPIFSTGSLAAVDAGHYWFGDLKGTVVSQVGEEVTLQIADFWGSVKISCWLLRPLGL